MSLQTQWWRGLIALPVVLMLLVAGTIAPPPAASGAGPGGHRHGTHAPPAVRSA